MSKTNTNEHRYREPWLHAGLAELKGYFEKRGLIFPEKIRCAFSLTSAGTKGARKSECWPADASQDQHCEIFISPDIAEPVEVLGQLCHALLHACLPAGVGHGPKFKEAALKIGMEARPSKDANGNRLPNSGMRHPEAGPVLHDELVRIAANLGPLPHARLDFTWRILDRGEMPADREKKQGIRMLKAICPACGYTVRGAAKWLNEVGPPHCPEHGPMTICKADDPKAASEPAEPAAMAQEPPPMPPEVVIMPPPATPPAAPPAGAV